MAAQFDNCPKCGATIMKGAMRCTSCGTMLTTPQQQKERIDRLRESGQKRSVFGPLVKWVVFLVAAGVLWYFFYDEITDLARDLIDRFLG